MIELGRHIEILLLSNDCVIVPDLGGFMAHHMEARYDEEEHMFLPPFRTLGFNPQLKLNDSLLAQSYIEAYDISYPEALRRIESEVIELKQHLANEGRYELNGLGMLMMNDEARLTFEPCEAGILTPELYGLSTFEFALLSTDKQQKENATVIPVKTVAEVPEDTTEKIVEDTQEEDATAEEENAIVIKMSWVRNMVAAAAALLAFFVMSPNIGNNSQDNVSMSTISLPIITKPAPTAPATIKDTIEAKAIETITEEKEIEVAEPQQETGYCIVLASQVSQHNAEEFVKQLQKDGITDARVYLYNNTRRVICGQFKTESEAYQQLQKVHRHPTLADAWVYKIKH